jgi:hypothetical protein
MKLIDINKRYIDDSLRYFIFEIYSMNKNKKKEVKFLRIRKMLEKRTQSLLEKGFIIDWCIELEFWDISKRRDLMIEGLLNGTKCDYEEFIEVLYRMQDGLFYSVRIEKHHLDSYVQVL